MRGLSVIEMKVGTKYSGRAKLDKTGLRCDKTGHSQQKKQLNQPNYLRTYFNAPRDKEGLTFQKGIAGVTFPFLFLQSLFHGARVMKLIGMLDSPYVRRVAIGLDWLGIPFEHQALSVFSTYDQFRAINPVVKAPTLICDDGSVMMDSTLILQYAESLFPSQKNLAAQSVAIQQRLLRCIGLALAACDKSVQLYYEFNIRPESARYLPWADRVKSQIRAAFAGLENEISAWQPQLLTTPNQASITATIALDFAVTMIPGTIQTEDYPALTTLWQEQEDSELFKRYPPTGPGVPFGADTK